MYGSDENGDLISDRVRRAFSDGIGMIPPITQEEVKLLMAADRRVNVSNEYATLEAENAKLREAILLAIKEIDDLNGLWHDHPIHYPLRDLAYNLRKTIGEQNA